MQNHIFFGLQNRKNTHIEFLNLPLDYLIFILYLNFQSHSVPILPFIQWTQQLLGNEVLVSNMRVGGGEN
jgi:hypothetical protein